MPDTSTQYVVQSQQLPAWYEQYLQSLAGRADVLSGAPYQAYGGQRTAALTPDQLAAYQSIRGMQGQQQPYIDQASRYTQEGATMDPNAAAQPYYDYAGTRIGAGADYNVYADADPYIQRGLAGSAAGAASPYLTNATGTDFYGQAAAGDAAWNQGLQYLAESGNRNTAAIYNPFADEAQNYTRGAAQGDTLSMAQPYFQQAAGTSGLAAAQPYLTSASRSFTDAAGEYMNPYISGVTDRIADIGARNLSEKLLPQISDDLVRAGQYGSTAHRDLVGRALRDTQESVLGQQSEALERGYNTAAQTFGADAARQAGLAGTAGQLGLGQGQLALDVGRSIAGTGASDLDRQLAAAGITSSIGSTAAGLSQADAARMASTGASMGELGLGRGQLGLSAAQSVADTQLRAGQMAGQFTGQDADRSMQAAGLRANIGMDTAGRQLQAGQQLAGIGTARAGTQAATADRRLAAGNQMANIGGLNQDLALRGAAALEQSGLAQQGQTQRGLDVNYANWQEQQQYPWQQLNNYSSLLRGQQLPTTTSTQGQITQPGPSTGQQIAGIGLGVAGLANSGIFRAKGGKVTKPKARSTYGSLPRRGLGFMMQEAA